MKYNGKVNILYSFGIYSDEFLELIQTSIHSLVKRTDKDELKIFLIVNTKTSEDYTNKLSKFIESLQVDYEIIDGHNENNYSTKDFGKPYSYFGEDAFARLDMAKLLPSHVERVLYLDTDTLINTDISDLFLLGMNEKTISAVEDFGYYTKAYGLLAIQHKIYMKSKGNFSKEKGLDLYKDDKKHRYLQSGVLLVDLNRWRSLDYDSKLNAEYKRLTKLIKEDGKFFLYDQEVINAAFVGDVNFISYKGNNTQTTKLVKRQFYFPKPIEKKPKGIIHYAIGKPNSNNLRGYQKILRYSHMKGGEKEFHNID